VVEEGRHFHVAILLHGPKNIRDPRFFDFAGVHPNVQSIRSLKRTIEYVKKDGVNGINEFYYI